MAYKSFIESKPKAQSFFNGYKDEYSTIRNSKFDNTHTETFLEAIVKKTMRSHVKKLEIEPNVDITVIIDMNVLRNTQKIVSVCSLEVGWLYTGYTERNGDQLLIYYTDIHVPEQYITGAETDITPKGSAAVLDWAVANNVQFVGWGHSHVNMGITPSGTDVNTFADLSEYNPIMTRLICNKKGALAIDVRWKEWKNLPHLQRDKISWRVEGLGAQEQSVDYWKEVVNENCKHRADRPKSQTQANTGGAQLPAKNGASMLCSVPTFNWEQKNPHRL